MASDIALIGSTVLLCLGLEPGSALPNAARVVLGAGDDGIALIVESAREYFILVSFEYLVLVPCVNRPQPAGLIAASRNDLVALGVEGYL